MKYIIFETRGIRLPVIFPDHLVHSDIQLQDGKPISAGFCTADGTTYGKSDSLKLAPHPQDELFLRAALTNNTSVLYYLMFAYSPSEP